MKKMEAFVQSRIFSWQKRRFLNKIGGVSRDISRKKSFLQDDIKKRTFIITNTIDGYLS